MELHTRFEGAVKNETLTEGEKRQTEGGARKSLLSFDLGTSGYAGAAVL